MKTITPILSLIIPCFNEAENIKQTLKSICQYLSDHYPQIDCEILPINDGSTDDTASIIKEFAKADSRVISGCGFEKNRGRGAAIKKGIAISRGEYVICLDADLSYDVNHIGEIFESFSQDSVLDVVIVSAYMPGGSVQGVPLFRKMLSRFANWVLSGSFPGKLHTVTCVVRGYRGNLVRRTPFFEDSKELHLEMLGKLFVQGARVLEIPGRLHWKNQTQQPRRKSPLKILSSTRQHLLYGLLLKPTLFFQIIAMLTLFVAVYESFVILWTTYNNFFWDGTFAHSLWLALRQSYSQSAHTFVIAGVAYVLSFQLIFFLILLQVLMMQNAELQRLILHFGAKDSLHKEND